MIYYNLQDKLHNGYIFKNVTKVMYWLPQEGQIANDALIQHLACYAKFCDNLLLEAYIFSTLGVSFCVTQNGLYLIDI